MRIQIRATLCGWRRSAGVVQTIAGKKGDELAALGWRPVEEIATMKRLHARQLCSTMITEQLMHRRRIR